MAKSAEYAEEGLISRDLQRNITRAATKELAVCATCREGFGV